MEKATTTGRSNLSADLFPFCKVSKPQHEAPGKEHLRSNDP
jgi:hypothetical protein